MIWDRVKSYWEYIWGTHLEFGKHVGNIKGMPWEHTGNNKNSTTPPSPKRGKKNPPKCYHWLHEIFICKIVCHHFQPRLIPPLCTKLGYLLYGVYIWYNYRCILSMVIYSCFNSLDVGVGPSPVLFLFLQ